MTGTSCKEGDVALQTRQFDSASKHDKISSACREGNVDALVSFAGSEGGLLDDHLRATAWPLLLGCTIDDGRSLDKVEWRSLPQHQDEEQVQKDVDRAFVYYPVNETEHALAHRKTALLDLIVHVLRVNPMLHYFQGFHDIAQVLLLVLGKDAAFPAVSRLSLLRIRDYMLISLGPAEKHLQLIPAILQCADAQLANHLGSTPPYFALSAVLTLYAHDIQEYADIARLYDFILAHEPVMTIYLFAALVTSRREELLEIPAEDHDMLLFTLSKLPQPLDLQALIDSCLQIYRSCPPERLPGRAWSDISSDSVLKTSAEKLRTQSLEEARRSFARQSQQLTRQQLATKLRSKPMVKDCGVTDVCEEDVKTLI
ncbi:GTPase-activating protein gyp8 [Lithohypha guttulata]|uniref:GTPase-activating protein gyp8 n=1 Tax=Lithohypha guttulata TaxID=1690604 RepID=UPI002DE17237|nr:GTPase-activating protein gyp8 [Lithohypha guttulata]